MKFKAVTIKDAPLKLKLALDQLRSRLEKEVVAKFFGVPVGTMGPAEMYVQETDPAVGQEPFVSYNASSITIKEGRDFDGALQALKDIVYGLIREHWKGVGKIQVMVVIHASSAEGERSRLYESVADLLIG